MNTTRDLHIWQIRELVRATKDEAAKLYDVIESQDLVTSWPLARNQDIQIACAYARSFIDGNSVWE